MAGIVSTGLKDCSHLKVVSVISSFDCDGNIKPLYVRIDDTSLKIHTSYLSESYYRIYTFQCEVMDNDIVKPLKLTYHTNECLWTIPA